MTQICGNGTCSQCQATANCTVVPRKSCLAQRSEGYLTSLNPIHNERKEIQGAGLSVEPPGSGMASLRLFPIEPLKRRFPTRSCPLSLDSVPSLLSDSFFPLNPNTFSFFRIRFRRSRERLADIEEAFRYKDRNAAGGALTLATLRAFAVRS